MCIMRGMLCIPLICLFLWCLLQFNFESDDVGFDFLEYGCEFRFAVLHSFVGCECHVECFDEDLDFVGVELVHCLVSFVRNCTVCIVVRRGAVSSVSGIRCCVVV